MFEGYENYNFGLLDIFKKNDTLKFANGKINLKKLNRKTHFGHFDYKGKTLDIRLHGYKKKFDMDYDDVFRTMNSYISKAIEKLKWFVTNPEINKKNREELVDFLSIAYPVQFDIHLISKDDIRVVVTVSSRDNDVKNEFYVTFRNSPSNIVDFKMLYKGKKENGPKNI